MGIFQEIHKNIKLFFKKTTISLGVSLTSSYRLQKHIKGVCEQFLLNI